MNEDLSLGDDGLDPEYYIRYDKLELESDENKWTKIASAILKSSRESRQDLYQKVNLGLGSAEDEEVGSPLFDRRPRTDLI